MHGAEPIASSPPIQSSEAEKARRPPGVSRHGIDAPSMTWNKELSAMEALA